MTSHTLGALVCAVALLSVPGAARQDSAPPTRRSIPSDLSPGLIMARVEDLTLARDPRRTPASPADDVDQYMGTVWTRLGLPDPWNGRCPVCEALSVEELAPTRFVALRVEVASWTYRFIVFFAPDGPGTPWKLAGFVDTDAKYIVPAGRLESIPNRMFFVVDNDTGGTGIYDRGETWTDLTSGVSTEVLTLPIEGHDEFLRTPVGNGAFHLIDHAWQSRIAHRPDRTNPVLRLSLSVQYSLWDDVDASEVGLFARTQTAAFLWDERDARFHFDASRSDLTQEEFETVYAAEKLKAASFSKFNGSDVARIAAQGTQREKRAFEAFGLIPPR